MPATTSNLCDALNSPAICIVQTAYVCCAQVVCTLFASRQGEQVFPGVHHAVEVLLQSQAALEKTPSDRAFKGSGADGTVITLLGKNLSSDPTCANRGTLMFSGCIADSSTLSSRVQPDIQHSMKATPVLNVMSLLTRVSPVYHALKSAISSG